MLVIWGEYSLFLLVQFIYTLKPHCPNITGQWEQKFPCYIKPPQLIHYNLFLQPKISAAHSCPVTATPKNLLVKVHQLQFKGSLQLSLHIKKSRNDNA